jgi:AbrB family looped-hinge helix DNA binding protein
MPITKISVKGSVHIPKAVRLRCGLKPGMRVQVVDYGGVLSLIPLLTDAINQAAGMRKGETSLIEALLIERAYEKQ